MGVHMMYIHTMTTRNAKYLTGGGHQQRSGALMTAHDAPLAYWTEWEFRSVDGKQVTRVVRRAEPNDRQVQHEFQRVVRQWLGRRSDP